MGQHQPFILQSALPESADFCPATPSTKGFCRAARSEHGALEGTKCALEVLWPIRDNNHKNNELSREQPPV